MFNDLAAKNPDKSNFNTKISAGLAKMIQDLNNKADANTIMTDAYVNLHPVIISGYNIQEVPEFPMPALLAIISIVGVIAVSRFRSVKLRQ